LFCRRDECFTHVRSVGSSSAHCMQKLSARPSVIVQLCMCAMHAQTLQQIICDCTLKHKSNNSVLLSVIHVIINPYFYSLYSSSYHSFLFLILRQNEQMRGGTQRGILLPSFHLWSQQNVCFVTYARAMPCVSVNCRCKGSSPLTMSWIHGPCVCAYVC